MAALDVIGRLRASTLQHTQATYMPISVEPSEAVAPSSFKPAEPDDCVAPSSVELVDAVAPSTVDKRLHKRKKSDKNQSNSSHPSDDFPTDCMLCVIGTLLPWPT